MSLASKLWNLIAFGTLGPVNDGGPAQTAQVSVGYMEVQDARPVVGLFGLASNAPAGSDVIVLYQGGDRSKGVVIGINHQGSRPTGQTSGETTLYNAFDMTIQLGQSGIVINGGGMPLQIENVGGSISMDGTLTVTQGINMTGTLAVTGGPIMVNGTIVTIP